MSGSRVQDDPNTPRPWHGAANPLVALHDWMLKELAALEARLPPKPVMDQGPKPAPYISPTPAPKVP